jgi:hypothetical protein
VEAPYEPHGDAKESLAPALRFDGGRLRGEPQAGSLEGIRAVDRT